MDPQTRILNTIKNKHRKIKPIIEIDSEANRQARTLLVIGYTIGNRFGKNRRFSAAVILELIKAKAKRPDLVSLIESNRLAGGIARGALVLGFNVGAEASAA